MLAPERLLLPDEQAVEILKLVDGARNLGAIIDELAARFDAPRALMPGPPELLEHQQLWREVAGLRAEDDVEPEDVFPEEQDPHVEPTAILPVVEPDDGEDDSKPQ